MFCGNLILLTSVKKFFYLQIHLILFQCLDFTIASSSILRTHGSLDRRLKLFVKKMGHSRFNVGIIAQTNDLSCNGNLRVFFVAWTTVDNIANFGTKKILPIKLFYDSKLLIFYWNFAPLKLLIYTRYCSYLILWSS